MLMSGASWRLQPQTVPRARVRGNIAARNNVVAGTLQNFAKRNKDVEVASETKCSLFSFSIQTLRANWLVLH